MRTNSHHQVWTFAMLVVFLLGQSCSKSVEEGTPLANIGIDPKSGDGDRCARGVHIGCGSMLRFDDAEHFQEVYDCLELAYEAYNDSVDQLYGSLADEAYNDLLDSIGFIDEQPLVDFEQNFSGYFRIFST